MNNMALDKQIHVHSVDTGHFYSNKERYLHNKNMHIRQERSFIHNKLKQLEKKARESDEYTDKKIKSAKKYELGTNFYNTAFHNLKKSDNLLDQIHYWTVIKHHKSVLAKKTKDKLLAKIKHKVDTNIKLSENGHRDKVNIRCFYENDLNDTNTVSLFESFLSRTIKAETNQLCEDLVIVQVYYFDIFKDLCFYGMNYCDNNGVVSKYKYFTSSAGQIRTKKAVFIKEETWNKYEKTLMCGLTIDKINSKDGNNPNKHLAYMALTNSATDLWEDFDIDKTIVIDDMETFVSGEFDSIDDKTYEIKRITSSVPIPHMDGCGMVLPKLLNTNSMIRIPWIKGLLAKFDYVALIKEKGWSTKIKDIYGKEHDILEEDIQIIFTKSQFKMSKYYKSWEEYKKYYHDYGCTAGLCNMEEEYIKNASINYQMLQTLTDITDDEIETLSKKSIKKLTTLCDSKENIKHVLGINPYNDNLTPFQEAVKIYEPLLGDTYTKDTIREIKNSMIKKYRSGKLDIYGKYTFLIPDLYAVCEYYFGDIKNPTGLLADQEVYCNLFPKSEKLDCLRSPHLYKEHAVRSNIAYEDHQERKEEISKWFTTNAIYTSVHDLISRVLQFDNDGDKALVVADRTFIEVAERNMEGIVPLYYEMKKAKSETITPESIYKGLIHAFTGSNIGPYSNNISKIFNGLVFFDIKKSKKDKNKNSDQESQEEKRQKEKQREKDQQEAINVVKWLCMENNFVIDYAKTLYKPIRPQYVAKKIAKFTKDKLPHFFIYAKDKNEDQVEPSTTSFVNKIYDVIPRVTINTRNLKIGEIDYEKMMSDINTEPVESVKKLYDKLNKQYRYKFNIVDERLGNDSFVKEEIKKEFAKTGYSEAEITDMLVKYLYSNNKRYKQLLWFVYGDYVVENLKHRVKIKPTKKVQCVDCGGLFEVATSNMKKIRCNDCQKIFRKQFQKELMRKRRQKSTC